MARREVANEAHQLAQMRYNIHLERAKKAELEKMLEESQMKEKNA